MSDTAFRLGQCPRRCHPVRYTVVRERAGLRRQWRVRDNHLDYNLSRVCKTEDQADSWRASLQKMDAMERASHLLFPFYAAEEMLEMLELRPPRPDVRLPVDEQRAANLRVAEIGRQAREEAK